MKSSIATLCLAMVLSAPCQAATVWTGPLTTFTNPDNDTSGIVDTITPNVILDRGEGGSIFNVATEGEFSVRDESPIGTLWARGSIGDGLENLSFGGFVPTVCLYDCGGSGGLGRSPVETVLYSVADDLYVDVIWTSWTSGGFEWPSDGLGGFTYLRSTPVVPEPSAFALIGLGLLALVMVRRRR